MYLLSDILFANISSQSVVCLFSFLSVFFEKQNVFTFHEIQLILFFFFFLREGLPTMDLNEETGEGEELLNLFCILFVGVVMRIYAYMKTHWTIHQKM